MTTLTDRQRVELAIPAYLFYALTAVPGAFVPADPDLAARAETDIAGLRANLREACLEPFTDLPSAKRQALERRLRRVGRSAMADWQDRSALSLMLALWHFLADLTDREILHLWEDSVMDRATRRLLPMFEHGFDEPQRVAAARSQAGRLLAHLQAEGFYR